MCLCCAILLVNVDLLPLPRSTGCTLSNWRCSSYLKNVIELCNHRISIFLSCLRAINVVIEYANNTRCFTSIIPRPESDYLACNRTATYYRDPLTGSYLFFGTQAMITSEICAWYLRGLLPHPSLISTRTESKSCIRAASSPFRWRHSASWVLVSVSCTTIWCTVEPDLIAKVYHPQI